MMNLTSLEPWAVHIALRERKLVSDRLVKLDRQRRTPWADREICSLKRDLAEIDAVIVRHRATAPNSLN
jgi:hypothetical protein